METFVPQPPAASEIGGFPKVAMTRLSRHDEDRTLSELAFFLGMTGDMVITALVLSSGFWMRSRGGTFEHHGARHPALTWGSPAECIAFGVFSLLGCFICLGIYRQARLLDEREAAARIILALLAWAALFAGMPLFSGADLAGFGGFLLVAAANVTFCVSFWRQMFYRSLKVT